MSARTRLGAPTGTAQPHDPAYQAFVLLRTAFTVAPVVFGLDKFFDVLTDWAGYLAPAVDHLVPGSAPVTDHGVRS